MLSGRFLSSQSATQPPANYQGPTVWGVCVYIIGDTSYYSNIFSTSGYYKFKAQQAFHDYATTEAKGPVLKGIGCRWSTSQEEVTTQKAADKKLLGLAPLGMENTESPQVATAEAQHREQPADAGRGATSSRLRLAGIVADVADVAGSDIIVNVGTQAGVHVGTKFAVMHAVRTVKDPYTGKVLRTIEDKVGELTIQNADATSAAGVFSGATPAKVGDTVRLPSTQ